MPNVLMIAEKPSLAESLAKILSNNQTKSRKGSNSACSVHEYRGTFNGISNCLFKFTSVCGHVMTSDFTGKYNNWDLVEPIELFDEAQVIKKEANPNLHMVKFLQNEAKNCDYLVLWLDCDKEGENICFEVIDAVCKSMRISFRNPQTVFRARFSAITEKDIKNAMRSLVLPNELEALSVDARQEADLRIGCAFTRFQTRFFHGKYGDLDSALISFGPCQTPTLGFCVERHDVIQSFQPQPYWVLQVTISENDGSQSMQLSWTREREFNQNSAKSYLAHVKNNKFAKVTSITSNIQKKSRPLALNTVELLRVASSALSLGPHHAMQVAERLYTQGYISYPRTETNQYPANFDLAGTLGIQSSHSGWGDYVKNLLKDGVKRPKSGKDCGDHPPITPMRSATSNDFSDRDSWRLYEYIVRHFIGSLGKELLYEKTTINFTIGEEKFYRAANKIVDKGFTEVMPWLAIPSDQIINVDIKTGNEFVINEAKLIERKTTPPDYLSEADLISLMEKHGIGTDASIPTHINNICLRNYVKVESGRRLVPTQLGIVLVHGYQKIDNELVLPTTRSNIEKQLNKICTGEADFQKVLTQTLNKFREKFDNFIKNINSMDELFEVSFSSLADSGKPFSRCGSCRRYLKLISAKPVRLYCKTCNQTYSLPHNGNVRTYKEIHCPLDDFELIYFTNEARSFVMCPKCYNEPPFEDMAKNSGCNQCPNKECEQSMCSSTINSCKDCTFDGQLVLDQGSGSPRWSISCNKCFVSYKGFKDVIKVNINENLCDNCKSHKVTITFKSGHTPNELKGCIFCEKNIACRLNKIERKMNSYGSNRGRGAPKKGWLARGAAQRGAANNFGDNRNPNNNNNNANAYNNPRGRASGRGRGSGGRRGRGGRGRGRGKGSDDEDNDVRQVRRTFQLSEFF